MIVASGERGLGGRRGSGGIEQFWLQKGCGQVLPLNKGFHGGRWE